METDFIELVIDEVYPSGTGPLCLSEVILYEPADVLALKPEMRAKIEEAMGQLADPEKGDAAAKALASVGAPAVPWLVALKNDPNPVTRARVVSALGQTGAPGAAPVLREIYDRSIEIEVRRAVLVAMRNLHSSEAVEFLGKVAQGDEPELARLALLAMEGIGDSRAMKVFLNSVIFGDEMLATTAIRHLVGFGDDAVKALGPYLRDKRIEIRARAVWALGRAGGPAVQDRLLKFINTGDLPIVLAGMRGLGETGAPEAFDTLSANWDHELPEVRMVVVNSLANFPKAQSAEVLAMVIRQDQDPKVVEAAWKSLTRIGPNGLSVFSSFIDSDKTEDSQRALKIIAATRGPGALSVLIDRIADQDKALRRQVLEIIRVRKDGGARAIVEALGHEDSSVRFAATRHLVSMGPRAVVVLVESANDSDDPAVRVAAIRCLGAIGDPKGSSAIVVGMGSKNRRVRRAAVRAASRIPAKRYGDTLVKLLDDGDDEVRLGAIEALGSARVKKALPTLIARMEGGDRNSIRIIWALGELGDESALPSLAKQLESNEAFTRQIVVEALGKIGGREATGLLLDAMVDPDRSVRKKAELALSR
jgi:HEAT repeat protein